MSETSPNVVERSFAANEFATLLTSAAAYLVGRCRTEYCDPAPPANFVFALRPSRLSPTVARGPLVSTTEVVDQLLRPDGSFRDWINLSPMAVTDDATVLEVDYPDRFTHRLLVGKLAFPFEPFHLLGPAL